MNITVVDLVAMSNVLEDLWEGRVTSKNFNEWRTANGRRILKGVIRTGIMLDDAGIQKVDLIPTPGAHDLVTNA
jgi:hypothetical protein